MKAYLKLVRYQNLLMLILTQLVLKYGFLKLQDMPSALNDWQYLLLVLATVAIAAGGYLINNIFDQETDLVNKPDNVVIGRLISESKAYNLYAALNITGVGIGFYLANLIGKPAFAMIFIVIAGTLYLYASSLKQSLLIGNLLIAAITAFSVIIVGIFELYPIITPENNGLLGTVFRVMLDYAFFCFVISFIREIVKDLEDVKGDYNQGMRTLPIVLGVSRTVRVVFVLSLLPVVLLLLYINTYYIANDLYIGAAYTLLLVVGPLLYFFIKCWQAKTQKDFRHLSTVLKLVLLSGIVSIFIISLNIRINA